MLGVGLNYFPQDMFQCALVSEEDSPLVVSPLADKKMDLAEWAQSHQVQLAHAIKEYGAIVFSGFNLSTKEDFGKAFTAITGMVPDRYPGEIRKELGSNIYKSAKVANGHAIPLHQEFSYADRKRMPKYISFFCIQPPKEGTGQTTVGNVATITKKIQNLMPDLWALMTTQTLTYTSRYLPSNSWLTRWIRWLNPSFATIQQQFRTENPKQVEDKCEKDGLKWDWDGRWAIVTRKAIPAILQANSNTLFCNQMHLFKLSPKLCGGWINYIFARILLFPISRFMQADVKFDNGRAISLKECNQLLTILEENQKGRDWKKGDLMILDNGTTMHGKKPHTGERKIIVAMAGSVDSSETNTQTVMRENILSPQHAHRG